MRSYEARIYVIFVAVKAAAAPGAASLEALFEPARTQLNNAAAVWPCCLLWTRLGVTVNPFPLMMDAARHNQAQQAAGQPANAGAAAAVGPMCLCSHCG